MPRDNGARHISPAIGDRLWHQGSVPVRFGADAVGGSSRSGLLRRGRHISFRVRAAEKGGGQKKGGAGCEGKRTGRALCPGTAARRRVCVGLGSVRSVRAEAQEDVAKKRSDGTRYSAGRHDFKTESRVAHASAVAEFLAFFFFAHPFSPASLQWNFLVDELCIRL